MKYTVCWTASSYVVPDSGVSFLVRDTTDKHPEWFLGMKEDKDGWVWFKWIPC